MTVTVDQGEIQRWFEYVDNHAITVSGGAPKMVCPMCSDDHIICHFTAGSLTCDRFACENPHHHS